MLIVTAALSPDATILRTTAYVACIAINTQDALAALLLRPVAAHVHVPSAANRHGSSVQEQTDCCGSVLER